MEQPDRTGFAGRDPAPQHAGRRPENTCNGNVPCPTPEPGSWRDGNKRFPAPVLPAGKECTGLSTLPDVCDTAHRKLTDPNTTIATQYYREKP